MPGAIVSVIALGVIAFFLIPSQTVLVVRTVKPEKAVLCARMTDGEEWMISYTHSVNRRPVYDFLRIEGNGLRILRSRYRRLRGRDAGDLHAGKSSPHRTGRLARIHGQPSGFPI